MDNAASLLLPSAPASQIPARAELSEERRSVRLRQRRQILAGIALAYFIDALILSIYARAGTTSAWVGPAFAATAILYWLIGLVVSETGFSDRFRDHYLTMPQALVNMAIMFAFASLAPEVGVVFVTALFIVLGFGSLRFRPQQAAAMWLIMTLGLGGLFLAADQPISMPHGNTLERLATMLVFTFTIGRSMFLGTFSRELRHSLYQNSLKLKEAYRIIEELAQLDELTGSFNRRSIMRLLDEEIGCARDTARPCSIALIDLDWFKRVNDAYGHPTGDEVLRTFAITAFANIRDSDRFGRYGGEEFLLVLPGSAHDEAKRMLERLQCIVAGLDWSAFSPDLRVTISAGVATLQSGDDIDSILARADAALYEAKAQGRNRVIISAYQTACSGTAEAPAAHRPAETRP
ncbi:MAG: GGDEF domain-containing protein [Bradyrhizobium sp.]|uniref:GGDEF domain-containing protein n=1 Tax=Bradyrhizobium sp. TaxID=376 RepID=UPI0025C03BBE|nr:GGDEF domain-containing protein [Bradyrhizobium sp.]MBI5264663.1 GGDEF domain-containing protein [Bradyrhizobium sp.]